MSHKALFLDRDGVINRDTGYVYQQQFFQFIDGIFDVVAHAKRLDYRVIVVSNQAGIGRGYFTETDFWTLMDWVKLEFQAHHGDIDQIYFCPHHPEHGLGAYQCKHPWRKPEPGMLLAACQDFHLDLSQSLLIGDQITDLEAGIAAGVGQIFYFQGKEPVKSCVRIQNLKSVLNFL